MLTLVAFFTLQQPKYIEETENCDWEPDPKRGRGWHAGLQIHLLWSGNATDLNQQEPKRYLRAPRYSIRNFLEKRHLHNEFVGAQRGQHIIIARKIAISMPGRLMDWPMSIQFNTHLCVCHVPKHKEQPGKIHDETRKNALCWNPLKNNKGTPLSWRPSSLPQIRNPKFGSMAEFHCSPCRCNTTLPFLVSQVLQSSHCKRLYWCEGSGSAPVWNVSQLCDTWVS